MTGEFRVVPSVFIAATREHKVVLQLRQNTGFYDDHYDLPSGHVEPDESLIDAAVRELEEETEIKSSKGSLTLFHICQNFVTPGKPYEYHFFRTSEWSGEPVIGDPDKIGAVDLFDLDYLPLNTTPHVINALASLAAKEVGFSVIS